MKTIIATYSPQAKSTYPISDLSSALGFSNQDDVIEYLGECNVIISPCRRFLMTKLSKSKLVEVKPESNDHAKGVSHGRLGRNQPKSQGGLAALRQFLK